MVRCNWGKRKGPLTFLAAGSATYVALISCRPIYSLPRRRPTSRQPHVRSQHDCLVHARRGWYRHGSSDERDTQRSRFRRRRMHAEAVREISIWIVASAVRSSNNQVMVMATSNWATKDQRLDDGDNSSTGSNDVGTRLRLHAFL